MFLRLIYFIPRLFTIKYKTLMFLLLIYFIPGTTQEPCHWLALLCHLCAPHHPLVGLCRKVRMGRPRGPRRTQHLQVAQCHWPVHLHLRRLVLRHLEGFHLRRLLRHVARHQNVRLLGDHALVHHSSIITLILLLSLLTEPEFELWGVFD